MKTTRPWISVGGALLALGAGWTNAIGLVAATHAVLTHLTGTATRAATDLVAGDFLLVGKAAVLVLSFLLGSFLVGAVVHVSGEDVPPRRLAGALLVEAALLSVAWASFSRIPLLGESCVAAASGLQNALVTQVSGAVVRTTHITGLVTDIGLNVGAGLRGAWRGVGDGTKLWGRAVLQGLLVVAFVVGGVLGALTFRAVGVHAFLGPVGLCTVLAIGAWIRRGR